MGHIQQLAFALGPVEARTAAPQRPRSPGRPARSAAAVQPLLLPESPVTFPTLEGSIPDAPASDPVAASLPAALPTPPAPAAPILAAPAPTPAPAPVTAAPAFRPPSAVESLLSDSGAPGPARTILYVVVGFARGRERRRSGWQRLAEQGFASRRPAEEHAARLLARGRADGVILARQDLGPDADATEEPVILARHGELPAELLEG